MVLNKLKANDNIKTVLTVHGTRQQLAKVSFDTLAIGGSAITHSQQTRNLGVIFDCELNMKLVSYARLVFAN